MVLAKQYRLYKKEDFRRMHQKSSRRVFWEYGSVMYKRNNMTQNRFAFVVSARVSKKSTVRNLLKRRTSEWVRKNTRRIIAGYDVVFVFSKTAVGVKPKVFFLDLERLLRSIYMIV